MSQANKKCEALETERTKLVEAVKALKNKIDAAQMLKKKQMLALEKAQKEAADAKAGSLATKEVEEMKMLLRGAEIEREASERKVVLAEEEVQTLRNEVGSRESRSDDQS